MLEGLLERETGVTRTQSMVLGPAGNIVPLDREKFIAQVRDSLRAAGVDEPQIEKRIKELAKTLPNAETAGSLTVGPASAGQGKVIVIGPDGKITEHKLDEQPAKPIPVEH